MLLTFINLGETEVLVLALLIFSSVVFAGYKALKLERGISMILWLIGIFGVPPIIAIIYLVRVYTSGSSVAHNARQ